MSTQFKSLIREVMRMAWQMVKKNGYSMSEALKTAWMNIKLKAAMKERIVKFYFQKVDGSIREAYGTLERKFATRKQGHGQPQKRVTRYKFTLIRRKANIGATKWRTL